MAGLNELTASDAARRIAAGEIGSEAVVADCIRRVEAREPAVQAWEYLDPAYALAQARARDAEAPAGPLHGVPVGVKDTYDTHDMPTTWGTPIHARNRPEADATAVALLRAAGAVILGKTVSTQFACLDPAKTRNPHDADRTPGGSSSGSAAAVADDMVPLALGSQTAGSVIRPAAFCGVVGYKASHGLLNRRGLAPIADALDTVGFMARSIEDVELVLALLTARRPAPAADAPAPRIGLCRTHLWTEADASAVEAVEDAAARLAAAGAEVSEVALPPRFADLTPRTMEVMAFEAARSFAHEWRFHRDRIGEKLAGLIERGQAIPFDDYLAALRAGEALRAEVAQAFDGCDLLLAASAKGEAPDDPTTTGDVRFQSMWTFLHLPCVTLPTHRGPNGLPVGIQLIGPWRGDDRLLADARWIRGRLAA